MSFQELANHNAIAWDFDGTLIEHPKSEEMHAFIKAHPEKTHVIVTFRSHGMQNRIWRELAYMYPDAPGQDAFKGVINIPNEAWEAFEMLQRARKLRNDTTTPLAEPEIYYVEWKGMICKDHGLTVLVDDKTEHTVPGCERYGICFVNPDDL